MISSIPDRIKDRACELWVRALRDPKYDTLGETRRDRASDPTGAVAMAEALTAALPRNGDGCKACQKSGWINAEKAEVDPDSVR